jgi:hypothetical protein
MTTFAENRINCARMALETARSYLDSADNHGPDWRAHCLKEAQRKIDDARFYLQVFDQLHDRRAA